MKAEPGYPKNGHKKYTLPEAVLRQFTGCMRVKDIGVKSNRFVKRLCISAIVCYITDLAFVVIRVCVLEPEALFFYLLPNGGGIIAAVPLCHVQEFWDVETPDIFVVRFLCVEYLSAF